MPPVREIDLHGLTEAHAEQRVRDFVMTSTRAASGQVVRIVTGKGKGSPAGAVLMPLVRRMLETTLAPFVVEFRLDSDGGSYLVRMK